MNQSSWLSSAMSLATLLATLLLLLHRPKPVLGMRMYAEVALQLEPGSGDFGTDDMLIVAESGAPNSSGNGAGKKPLRMKFVRKPTSTTPTPPPLSAEERQERLQVDIDDFLELMPADEVSSKIRAHYRSDADVQTALQFVNGKEFAAAFDVREVHEMMQWLTRAGVNIKAVLLRLDHLLGLSKLGGAAAAAAAGGGGGGGAQSSSTALVGQTTVGLNGLLEEVLALIPQDDVFILFFEKLDCSIAFANLVEGIGSPEFGAKLDSLKRSPELKKASAELSKHKIDIRKIIELLQGYFVFGM